MTSTIARLLLLVLLLVACGQGSVVGSAEDVADLDAVVEDVATLCEQDRDRERDQDRLGDLSGDQLQDRIRDQDMDRFFEGCDGLQVDGTDVSVDGDTATVEVRYRARGRWGEGSCVFAFERQDGAWRLQALPDCAPNAG